MTKLIINYKSGIQLEVSCDEFNITWDTVTGEATAFKGANMKPRPLNIGLTNIESVWEKK